MPNKPRPENKARPVRIEDGLWSAVQAIAAEDETTPSAVVREAVRRYVAPRHPIALSTKCLHGPDCSCEWCRDERLTYCLLTRGAAPHENHRVPGCPAEGAV